MRRDKMTEIKKWIDNPRRKPLILRGARQVGKTWLMKEAGKLYFMDVAYINFEKTPQAGTIFESGFNVDQMLLGLSALSGKQITPDQTLLILDEIQEAPKALTALKYFQEDMPELAIMAAGSYLGVTLHQGISFPVGKVELMDLHPLNFLEFLEGVDQATLAELLRQANSTLISAVRDQLIYYLKLYYFIGGMPDVINTFNHEGNLQETRRVQMELLEMYSRDFSKHIDVAEVNRINQVWQSIPGQLGKDNKKFIWKEVQQGARSSTYETAIMWLEMSGLINRVFNVSKPGLPLKSYRSESHFKIYLHDIGLLSAMSNLDSKTIIDGNRVFTDFKGALTEQFIENEIRYALGLTPYYYQKDRLEIDFLVEHQNEVYPIEVKAGENLKSKSLQAYAKKYNPKQSIRTSMSNYRDDGWLINLPLYGFSPLFFHQLD